MLERAALAKVAESVGCDVDGDALTTSVDKLLDAARALKSAGFAYFSFVTAVETKREEGGNALELVYVLRDLSEGKRVLLRVPLGKTETAPSVTGVWEGANWHERETFDLFGVRFAHHPDLRRILNDDETEGYPLRKSFPMDKPRPPYR